MEQGKKIQNMSYGECAATGGKKTVAFMRIYKTQSKKLITGKSKDQTCHSQRRESVVTAERSGQNAF